MNSLLKITAVSFFLFTLSSPLHAQELAGITFPKSITKEGGTLSLNGLGLRTATFFSIKVYVAALYVEKPTHKAGEIIASEGRKRIVMKFVRSVSAKKLQNAWREGFTSNTPSAVSLNPRIEQLCSLMVDVKEGDTLAFDITSKTTSVEYNFTQLGSIEGADFSQALLRVWLGPNPPNENLKKGLLGLSTD